jgi:hypothetical protein
MAVYLGIDNGLNGGLVVLDDNQNVIRKYVMPIIKGDKTEFDIVALNKILDEIQLLDENIYVGLEKAHVRPVQGIRAAFTTGFCLGMFQALLTSKGIGYEVINPSVWMKKVFEGINSDDKKVSVMYCQRKWPQVDWRATERSSKAQDGMTDAACIALYVYSKQRGIQ